MALSESELSRRSGTTLERIREFVRLGILEPQDGVFRPADVQRVRVTESLDEAGIPPADVGRIVTEGHYSFAYVEALFPEPVSISDRTVDQVAEDVDLPMSLVERAFTLWAVARPGPGEWLREDDVEMLSIVAEVHRLLGRNEASTVAAVRYFGENLRRIAESQVRFFRDQVEEPMLKMGAQPEIVQVLSGAAANLIPLAARAVTLGHGRHLEHYVVEDIVENVEMAMERAGIPPPERKDQPGIAFVDLTGYTELTEKQGDRAAAELVESLADLVSAATSSRGGRAVKFLGDGVMLHFADPLEAVRTGLDLVERIPSAGLPPAHVGVNAGPVVFRDGDYFGRTVNVAARISDQAAPGEVLVSDHVATSPSHSDLRFDPLGERELKGIPEPVRLHRAIRTRT